MVEAAQCNILMLQVLLCLNITTQLISISVLTKAHSQRYHKTTGKASGKALEITDASVLEASQGPLYGVMEFLNQFSLPPHHLLVPESQSCEIKLLFRDWIFSGWTSKFCSGG